MKDKIVTFGEIMLRLSPENNARFTQCNAFEAVYGGGEANTAVSLANFDVDANYVTKLPKHIIGQANQLTPSVRRRRRPYRTRWRPDWYLLP